MDHFVNIKIVHENPLVDEYSFELVVQKLEKEISIESIQPFQQSLNENNMLIPPLEKIFDGSKSIEEFIQIGDEFLKYFIYLCKLKQNEKILEVGCGIGRMAIPLTKYLNKAGHYEGFDIVADGINWCRENITTKYPNFNFRLADVFNKFYNPKGRKSPSGYEFPYENESFDFVFLTSVFTHMLPDGIENYMREIYRVLKKNGRCLITFFLLNDESRNLIQIGESDLDFKYPFKDKKIEYLSIHPNNPEVAVAYEEVFIRDLYQHVKLEIQEPILWGSWCGRLQFLSFQDIIIAYKDRQKVPSKNYGGHVDLIEPSNPTLDSNIHMSGWAADLENMVPAESVVLVSNGKRLSVSPLMKLHREDVAQAYSQPILTLSGWEVTFNASILGKGRHRLEFYAKLKKNQLKRLLYKTKKYFEIEIID
jgi:ubiquinone/menaquinone biosynthesis C-methylase UbiE